MSEPERQEVFDAYAPEEWMRVYGRGNVRRLPTMLDGDPRFAWAGAAATAGSVGAFTGDNCGLSFG